MNKKTWINAASDYLVRDLAAKCAFSNFVQTNNEPFTKTLLEYIIAGKTDLDSLASELSCSKEELIQKLVSLRIYISDASCSEDKDAYSDFEDLCDIPQHGITTFRELAFFLESFPEVLMEIPKSLWEKELKDLDLSIDQQAVERLNDIAIRLAQNAHTNSEDLKSVDRINSEHSVLGQQCKSIPGKITDIWDRTKDSIQKITLSLEQATQSTDNTDEFAMGTLDNLLYQEVTKWRIPSAPTEDKVFLDVIRKRINVTDNNMSEFEFSITVDNSENLGGKSYDVAIFRVFPDSSANQQIGRSVLSSQNPQCQFYISAGRYDIPEIAIQPRRDVNDG